MANSNGWGDGAANNAIGWGQGANNNIGWGISHATSWAGATDIVGIDADALAFITAAAITDATQQSAIDTLVKGMKADGVWTKMKAIYPFVGGTATTHKWNLKDPRDLDAAFRLVFNGGWTHSSTGATPNGVNGYADTKFNPTTSLTSILSGHLSIYSRTNVTGGVDASVSNGGAEFTITANLGVSVFNAISNIGNQPAINNSVNTSNGFFLANRQSSTNNKIIQNTTTLASSTVASSATKPNANVWLGAQNNSGALNVPTSRQQAFTSFGDGLTDTEATNLYTRVQAFQTSLSRQV